MTRADAFFAAVRAATAGIVARDPEVERDDVGERADDIGDELADREEANDRNPSESRSSHEPVEFAGSDTTIADGRP